jgi:SEC-C motif-containing protein
MRSRYAAYALHLAKYIMKTTHPDNPSFSQKTAQWEKAILEFSKNTTFKDLTILEFIDGQTEAYVTFRATLFQSSRDVSFTEKSHFVKVGKAWLYESGEIYPDSTPSTL